MRAALLRWYDRDKRDLPWRRTRDPYAIWVSETMLQQTQVGTVIPYYLRFLERFPTITELARAPLEQVLSLWSGLGYYRRAENLRSAAGVLVAEHGGRLPCDYDALTRLPGVGPYTAGALLSIAFEKPYAAVDGNARRVYTRLFGLSAPKETDEAARSMLSRPRPGDYTQAVMELGSTLCIAAAPSCGRCPLAHWCSARRSGEYAVPARTRVASTALDWPLVVLESDGCLLLRRRPRKGLLAGLWELPQPQALADACATLRSELEQRVPVAVIRHAITHYRITAPVYVLKSRAKFEGASWAWVPLRTLPSYPLSSLSSKAIEAARRELRL